MPIYRHTQIGYVLIVSLGLAAVVCAALGLRVVAALLAVSAVLFATLTVTVDMERVGISFGPGLIRKSFPVAEIQSCRALRDKKVFAWGIHGFPGRGWLYNVSGFYCVELRMRDGMLNYIGTDDLDGLERAVNSVLRR